MVCGRNRCADPRREDSRNAMEAQSADLLPRLGTARPPYWRKWSKWRRDSWRCARQARFRWAIHGLCAGLGPGRDAPDWQQRRLAIRGILAPRLSGGSQRKSCRQRGAKCEGWSLTDPMKSLTVYSIGHGGTLG